MMFVRLVSVSSYFISIEVIDKNEGEVENIPLSVNVKEKLTKSRIRLYFFLEDLRGRFIFNLFYLNNQSHSLERH